MPTIIRSCSSDSNGNQHQVSHVQRLTFIRGIHHQRITTSLRALVTFTSFVHHLVVSNTTNIWCVTSTSEALTLGLWSSTTRPTTWCHHHLWSLPTSGYHHQVTKATQLQVVTFLQRWHWSDASIHCIIIIRGCLHLCTYIWSHHQRSPTLLNLRYSTHTKLNKVFWYGCSSKKKQV